MNEVKGVGAIRAASPRRGFRRGQNAVELAFAVPILILFLQVAADFGRLFYVYVELNGAARAGAQYGANSVTSAADSSGMVAAAQLGGPNVQNMSVTATQCTCMSGTSITACPASYCSAIPTATYVQVTASSSFHTLITYPGLPAAIPVNAQAILPVQQ